MTSKGDMVENVANSVRTAEEILAHLESSLRKGGFETGLAAYMKLGETMVNQRLWTQSEAPSPEMDKLFSALSARAKTLYGILGPYAELMRRLASLDSITPAVASTRGENNAEQRNGETDPLLQILKEGETSLSSLRARLSLGRKELEARLAAFQSQGRIQSRTSSGRRLYRLT